ncbi:hypothetical protein [Neorhizobium sp. DT-125]|uniref:hypothetical protein n=1 Tax=Neorhizobium sp. DT-125 TaxID=3396163 RepID=UPI003F1E2C7E
MSTAGNFKISLSHHREAKAWAAKALYRYNVQAVGIEVEEEARRRGCQRAVVETSSFQAPGFYIRLGYEEFGRVAFAVEGHARIFLSKHL